MKAFFRVDNIPYISLILLCNTSLCARLYLVSR